MNTPDNNDINNIDNRITSPQYSENLYPVEQPSDEWVGDEEEQEFPTYPEDPESEDVFRGQAPPLGDTGETSPLTPDVINDPWNETANLTGIDVHNMDGDDIDDLYDDRLGHKTEENEHSLKPDNYGSLKITKGR